MRIALVAVAGLLVVPLVVIPNGAAQTVAPECALVATARGTYEFTMCSEGIEYLVVKSNPDSVVHYTVTTDRGTMTCEWFAMQAVECDGNWPTGTPGTVATLDVFPWGGLPGVSEPVLFVIETIAAA